MKSGRQESVGLTMGQIQDLDLSTKGNQWRVFLGCGWIDLTLPTSVAGTEGPLICLSLLRETGCAIVSVRL